MSFCIKRDIHTPLNNAISVARISRQTLSVKRWHNRLVLSCSAHCRTRNHKNSCKNVSLTSFDMRFSLLFISPQGLVHQQSHTGEAVFSFDSRHLLKVIHIFLFNTTHDVKTARKKETSWNFSNA